MDKGIPIFEGDFSLGDYKLQNGSTIPNATIHYKSYGTLSTGADNAIVYPTWFTGFIGDNEWLIGEGMALDPSKYYIIVVCAFGNGQSSSPSNTTEPYDRARFPRVSLYDNVNAQHRLVTEYLGVKRVKLVVGWSMGAQQSYQWGCLYPDLVERIAPFCGSAKTAPHNFVFLEGVKAALIADKTWENGWYDPRCPPKVGLRAVARVYAGWGFSQPFYSKELWRELGYHSLEDFLVGFWEGFFLKRDANNLLAMLWTWQNADISANNVFNGDFIAALNAIKCPALILPAAIDLYFPPEDNQEEAKHIPYATYDCIPGVWGHFAGGGLNAIDTMFIDDHLKALLDVESKL